MWVLYALLVHVLLLGSIFVIYFRSPVIEGLQPQATLTSAGLQAPARRLVLIVTDGLRADSFFEHNCDRVPHLRNIFRHQGLLGISQTRVPTESRPGHIALIAGLYEDPSAVTRGWKENPIEFDTVFNRSEQTYAWGAQDVLHIFEKLSNGGRPMYFDAYNHDLDFSGQHKTYKLDEWVFNRVKLLLDRKQDELRAADHLVFFLHLLGLDTAGHVHKPGTPLFLENLNHTERGIWETYRRFEAAFPDGRTAYLLTSDHGMTDSGSHGAGHPHETDTPFFLWGAGVARKAPHTDRYFTIDAHGHQLPLHRLEQAQLTPLMSALIGLPPPMNNFGVLPFGYMNVSQQFEAHAAHSNSLQLLAQYQKLQQDHSRGLFSNYMNGFDKLTTLELQGYKANNAMLLQAGKYADALLNSGIMMQLALEGIDYYQGYYRNALLMATTAAFLGWMCYLYRLLTSHTAHSKAALRATNGHATARWQRLTLLLLAVLLLIFILLQQLPGSVGFYLLLPLLVWLLVVQQQAQPSSFNAYTSAQAVVPLVSKWHILLLVACAELLVLTFFDRRVISLCFVFFACYSNWRASSASTVQFFKWLLLVLLLASFPLLPPSVGYQNPYLLVAGIGSIAARALLSQRWQRYSWHTKLCNALVLLNSFVCMQLRSNQMGVPLPLRLASWAYLVYAFGSVLLNKQQQLELRLEQIFYNIGALYALLCTSYEALFVQLLATELTLGWMAQQPPLDSVQQLHTSFRLAFTILLYTFFSMFGSGNIASISSFDPNIARCFLSHFAPFVIMALVLLKLVLPVVLNMAILYARSEHVRQHERQIFICLLLICDIMGLNFLFLVRNRGSWQEIGSSISHFVIMQVTTLILMLLAYVAKLLLRLACCDRLLKLQ